MTTLYLVFDAGGLLLSVQDSAAAEEVEQVTQSDIGGHIANSTPTNLLSSGTFTCGVINRYVKFEI